MLLTNDDHSLYGQPNGRYVVDDFLVSVAGDHDAVYVTSQSSISCRLRSGFTPTTDVLHQTAGCSATSIIIIIIIIIIISIIYSV